ncbi:hypothetical protein GMO_14980 [Gluconobacter morbifer G707]|uniref:Uncharacterized protein n=1 Tax=Gluconobacter morbifer G707 TaxID=1088869 RepID=G6XJ32_9PROT|nr:hypothetical protein GMO_14980 [Gluconobacter morbifer G707]
MHDRKGSRSKPTGPTGTQTAQKDVGPVLQAVNVLQRVTTGDGVAEMSCMSELVQVVTNPSQLSPQLTEFTIDRSAATMRQDRVLQQSTDPVSSRRMTEDLGGSAPAFQLVRRGSDRQTRRSGTG